MTEQPKNDNFSMPQQNEPDILFLIQKIQQQLVFLEKKIDILVSQSRETPFREKSFSKPFRPSGRPYRPGHSYDKRGQGEDSRERGFRSGPSFEKHQRDENQKFEGPKKEYSGDRENSSGQDRPFRKKFGGKKGGFDPRKKSFFHKGKHRSSSE